MSAVIDTPEGDAERVRLRWISRENVEWTRQCDRLLTDYGAVRGTVIYERRDAARWRARKLIGYLMALGLRERWQLREHAERHQGGYTWSVELLKGVRER